MATTAELITQLYVGYYNRAPDPAGLNYWIGVYNSGKSLTDIANYFAAQDESKATYAYLANPNVADPNAFVNQIYLNMFGRAATQADKDYWVGQLNAGKVTPGAFIATIQYSANAAGTGDDFTTLKNKTAVGLDYATDLANANVPFTQASAHDVIAGVDKTDASVVAGMAKTDAYVAGGATGQTFNLTINTDTIPGLVGSKGTTSTDGNDTINAAVIFQGGNAATLNPLDVIDGGKGNDTLVVENTGGLNTLSATILNVENLTLRGAGAINGGTQVDASVFSGIIKQQQTDQSGSYAKATGQTFVLDRVADGTGATVAYEATATTAKLESTGAIGDAGFSYAGTGVTSASLKVDTTATGKTVTVADTGNTTKTVTVEASGKSSVLVNSTALEGVVAKGAGALTLNFGTSPTKSIDASASTGGVTVLPTIANGALFTGGSGKDAITLGANTKATVMGAGDDTVTLTGSALGVGGTVDGGDGVDTLSMTAANAATASATTTFKASFSNFEVLQIDQVAGGATANINMANLNNLATIKSAGTAAATGTAEVQTFTWTGGADASGGHLTVGGVDVIIPANATTAQVAAAIQAQSAAIIAANPTIASITTNGNVNTFTFTQFSGDAPQLPILNHGSGATFGAVTTTTGGTTGVNEVQTFQFTAGPTTSGTATITLPGGGTAVNVSLFAGQNVLQVAQAVRDAITAAGLTGITASVTNDTVTVTYANSQGNVNQGVFAAGGATGTASTDATTTNGVAAAAETQTFTVTGGTDANGGSIVVNGTVIELGANLTPDQVGLAIAAAQASIIANDPRVASVGYNTLTDTVTVNYTLAAGDVAANATTVADNTTTGIFGAFNEVTKGVAGTPGGVLNLTNVTSGNTLELTGTIGGASSVAVKDAATSTSDVFNIKLNGVGSLDSTGTLTVANVETLNIVSTYSGTSAPGTNHSVLGVIDTAATTLTVSGNNGLWFTGSQFGALKTFDASGVTAGSVALNYNEALGNAFAATGATITGGAGDDFLRGSVGKDTINAGAGADLVKSSGGGDTITLGAGNDSYILLNKTHSVVNLFDTITDFAGNTKLLNAANAKAGAAATGLTGDTIDVSAFVTQANGIKVFVAANAADAQTFIQNTASDGGNSYTGFSLDSSSGKLYMDFDKDGVIDSVVALTGVTTISEAAFTLHV